MFRYVSQFDHDSTFVLDRMKTRLLSLLMLFVTFGCVDRVFFDIRIPEVYGVSISGFISDQRGPYQVLVTRTFDTESKENLRTGVSARVVLSDNEGNSEVMTQITSGVYQTSADGLRGKTGNVYKVNVELEDGRVYESVPDTLFPGGILDSVYYKIVSRPTMNGFQYFFDMYGSSQTDVDLSKVHFTWQNKITFKALTHPEWELGPPPKNCYRLPDENKCNYVHPCSGLKNLGTDFKPDIQRVGPCTCCVCWYDTYNTQVVLNDKAGSVKGRFPELLVDHLPLSGWHLMYKMRVETNMQSLSPQAYKFWKAVRDQYTAVSNIFQPVTGKIKGNIKQVGGENSPAFGLFYATSLSNKVYYIDREDVRADFIPSINGDALATPCFNLFPNATTVQPPYWIE